MATIPKILQPHINTAFPDHVCLVGSVLPDGYAQITPRGSTMVSTTSTSRCGSAARAPPPAICMMAAR